MGGRKEGGPPGARKTREGPAKNGRKTGEKSGLHRRGFFIFIVIDFLFFLFSLCVRLPLFVSRQLSAIAPSAPSYFGRLPCLRMSMRVFFPPLSVPLSLTPSVYVIR